MAANCTDELPFICEECYQVVYDDCEDISIDLGLAASTSYCVKLIDKFNNVYEQTVTTDVNGAFEIDESLLPDNFFNQFSGKIEVQIYLFCADTDPVPFTAAYLQFNCLLLVNSLDPDVDNTDVIIPEDAVRIEDENGVLIEYVQCGDTYVCNSSEMTTESGITAHAGGGQASGRLLSKTYSRVDTIASNHDSVVLPAATVNKIMIIQNNGSSNILDIYPASGEAFYGQAADSAFSVANGNQLMVVCYNAGIWTQY